jgi:hypothetical protein
LSPDPISTTPDEPSAAFKNALDPTVGTGLANWGAGTNQAITVQYSHALNGTLSVDLYSAAISGPNFGGGQIAVHYNGAPPLNQNLVWVQLVTTTDPANPPGASPYLDIFASNYTAGNGYALKLPFFYRPDETTLDNATGQETGGLGIRNSNYTINGTNYAYNPGIAFDDWSQRSYTNHTVTWTGDLLLGSWTGPLTKPPGGGYGATTLTIYQGIQWGWILTPTPEPSAFFSTLEAGSVLLVFAGGRRALRSRRSRQLA